jgi:hypothetical protein
MIGDCLVVFILAAMGETAVAEGKEIPKILTDRRITRRNCGIFLQFRAILPSIRQR